MRRWSILYANQSNQFLSYPITGNGTTAMTILYVKSLLFIMFVSVVLNQNNLFTFHARQVTSNANDSCSPSTLSSLEQYQIFEETAIMYEKQIYSLVNETTHVFSAISVVFNRHELMCVPNEIYVQSWNEE